MDFLFGRFVGLGNCFADGELAKLESGDSESGRSSSIQIVRRAEIPMHFSLIFEGLKNPGKNNRDGSIEVRVISLEL